MQIIILGISIHEVYSLVTFYRCGLCSYFTFLNRQYLFCDVQIKNVLVNKNIHAYKVLYIALNHALQISDKNTNKINIRVNQHSKSRDSHHDLLVYRTQMLLQNALYFHSYIFILQFETVLKELNIDWYLQQCLQRCSCGANKYISTSQMSSSHLFK